MAHKGTWYKADGTVETVSPADGRKFTLKELQGFVGGFIERVQLPPGNKNNTMWINEEGLLLDLPPNNAASRIAGQYLVGDAIIVSGNGSKK